MRADQRSPEAAAYRFLYSTAEWKALRSDQLAAHPLCERCSTPHHPVAATTVNHVIPHKGDLVLFRDPTNLQSVCKPCHDGPIQFTERRGYSKQIGPDGFPTDPNHPAMRGQSSGTAPTPSTGAMARPSWFRPVYVPLTIVCGPPGAGKSTYVRERAQPGDLVVCFDDIVTELFGKRAAIRTNATLTAAQRAEATGVRNKLLGELMWARARDRWSAAWLILTEPKAEHREWWASTLKAHVTVLATPADECGRRMVADAEAGDYRGVLSLTYVDEWWRTYRPTACDETVTA